MSPVIYLARHGETEWNLARRYQGWGDSPLTGRGVAQAEAIGQALAAIPETAGAELAASPLGRARRTAEIIGEAMRHSRPIAFDDRLKEISLGSWDGLLRGEIEALKPGIFAGFGRYEWYFSAPGGETYDGFAGRLGAWLGELAAGVRIVVAHGIVTRVLRGLYAGLPRETALGLPVPQDRIWRLAGGRIDEIAAG